MARPFNNPNAPLSEGEALAVVVQVVPGNPHWKRVGTDCHILWGKAPCGAGIACPPPRTPRRGATREGEEVEGATPCF